MVVFHSYVSLPEGNPSLGITCTMGAILIYLDEPPSGAFTVDGFNISAMDCRLGDGDLPKRSP